MNIAEAMAFLQQGKKIRRKAWNRDIYVFKTFVRETPWLTMFRNGGEYSWNPPLHDLINSYGMVNDWEVME